MGCRTCPSEYGAALPLATWLPYVLSYVPDAPAEAAEHAIRLAAIDFCNETGVLTRDLLVDAMANVADYPLDVEGGYVIRGLKAVRDEYDQPLPLLQSLPARGSVSMGARLEGSSLLLVYPTPRVDLKEKWRVSVVTAPTPLTTELDRVLFDHYAEAIGFGATARVKMMPGGEWTDARGAQLFTVRYQQKRADAKARAQRNHQRGAVIAPTPRWA